MKNAKNRLLEKVCIIILLMSFLGLVNEMYAQSLPPSYIKSIVFKSTASSAQFPVVRLGESFFLEFDDLKAEENSYYYTIQHCNQDWQPSNLLKSEYLNGMDDQLIEDFSNSYSTLQAYTHYSLHFPNELTSFKISGNYILTVSDDRGNPVFSKRFVIYTEQVVVGMEIKRSQDLKYFDEKQVVQFFVRDLNGTLQNPQQSVKATILQNYRWNNAKTEIVPQYFLGNELIYKYNNETTSFWAGNEYFYFDNKDIRSAGYGVYQVELKNLYNAYLYTQESRENRTYTYNPDIDGDFLIQSDSGDAATESDYAWVHFSLQLYNPDWWNKEVFVYGKFSENELTSPYQLAYNEETQKFEGKVLLKQGFYNYKFAIKDGSQSDYNAIGGNFYQTENQYTVLIYYRPPGGLYDQVIGVANLASTNITQ